MRYHNNMTVAELYQLRTQKEKARYFIYYNMPYWPDAEQVKAKEQLKALTNEIRQIEQAIRERLRSAAR